MLNPLILSPAVASLPSGAVFNLLIILEWWNEFIYVKEVQIKILSYMKLKHCELSASNLIGEHPIKVLH